MAKIARTPYNAARWLTQNISADAQISKGLTGYCLFITADTASIDLTVNYSDKGSYMKIILTDDSSHNVNLILPAMEGVAIYEDSNGVGILSVGDNNETTLTLPSTATGGSYIDLICDGDKWYVQAMTHGVAWTQS